MREALIGVLSDKLVVSGWNDERSQQMIAEMAEEIIAALDMAGYVIVPKGPRLAGAGEEA